MASRLILLVVLLAVPALAETLPPLPEPVNHFSILVGVARLQEDPALRSDPHQAARIRGVLRHLQRNSASLLRLDLALADALTPAQRASLLRRVGEPDPMRFFDDLRRALAVLEGIGGRVGRAPVPAVTGRHPEDLDCVLVAYGVPKLRPTVTPRQARRLASLLRTVQRLADEDETSMRRIYRLLTPRQQAALRAKSQEWTAGRSPRVLEEDFERLLDAAARAVSP